MKSQHHKTGPAAARLFFVFAAAICYCAPGASAQDQGSAPASLHTWQEPHMGTVFTIRVWCTEDRKADAEQAVGSAFFRISELNQCCSDYIADSEINRIARQPAGKGVSISDALAGVLIPAQKLAEETQGAFDITVGPLIRQWRLSRKNSRLPSEKNLASALARSGWKKLTIVPPPQGSWVTLAVEGMQLDLGGIAKGHAADTALGILRDNGFTHALVAASGDIVVGDPPPGKDAWRVGIRGLIGDDDKAENKAELPADLTGLIELKNSAISTSGDLNQWIELDGVRYSHIVDPHTGLGLTRRCSVTVIAPTAIESDSLATACSVLDTEAALELIQKRGDGYHIRVRELDEAGQIQITDSENFPPPADPSPKETDKHPGPRSGK